MTPIETLVEWMEGFPDWLTVVIVSLLPIVELRGGIPVGFLGLKMPLLQTYVFSVIGNIIPIPLIFLLLRPVEKLLRKSEWCNRTIDQLYSKTRARATERVEHYKELGLILFVAIPLPFTGAWTGSLIAYLFGLSYKKSFPVIVLGVLIAGVIVSAVVYTGKLLWLIGQ
jgi:uncharacterized membrane protein